jgi:prepilin-type N-terminal cleavage/methylation domain-containing protein
LAVARSRGFTLIELLMVVVIIGILVTITIPRFANTKEKALVTPMKSDLLNLASAEESYYYDFAIYTTTLASMPMYQPSASVTITVNEASQGGWSATATSSGVVRQCYLFVGSAAPVGAATQEGQVACS